MSGGGLEGIADMMGGGLAAEGLENGAGILGAGSAAAGAFG